MPIKFNKKDQEYIYKQDDSSITFKAIPRAYVYNSYNDADDIKDSFLKSITLIADSIIDSNNILDDNDQELKIAELEQDEKENFLIWLYDESETFRSFADALILADKKKLLQNT